MNVHVSFSYNPQGAIAKLVRGLDGQGRIDLHAAMGTEVQQVTASHVGALERSPSSLLTKLGAAPTNFYKHAAERTESPAALASDGNAATLTLNWPGVGRAFRTITVVPVNAKALAIPMDRLAVGRSPRDCWAELGLFIPKGKGFIAMRQGNQIKVMWLLRRSVTQPQNRALLPSEAQWERAAADGAKNYLRTALN
jgi:hypothetical protein